jgi:hypothetical protein
VREAGCLRGHVFLCVGVLLCLWETVWMPACVSLLGLHLRGAPALILCTYMFATMPTPLPPTPPLSY